MPEVLKLRGAAAFSATRLARLTQNVQAALPKLKGLAAEHWYFVELNAPLAAADLERTGIRVDTAVLAAPRSCSSRPRARPISNA